MGEGHLSLGTMIVTVEPRRAGRGHLSLGTIILLGWGGGGGGSFVSRNYNSIPSAQGEGEGRCHGGHLSLGIMIFKCRTRKMEGHLSLGTIVLIVDLRGGGGGRGSFVSF